MLRRAFVTWRERHASWQEGHAKIARAAAVWHNRAVAGAWQQWKEGAIYQQELRLRLTGALGTLIFNLAKCPVTVCSSVPLSLVRNYLLHTGLMYPTAKCHRTSLLLGEVAMVYVSGLEKRPFLEQLMGFFT